MKQAQWAIASSARIGQLYADFVGQLYTAEIPKDLKVQDEWGNRPQEIFCDALVDKAEPIELKAVEGFDTCLKAATDYSWYNEWSRLCEKELNQMKPSEYPLSSEVKPEAGYVSTTMSPSPVVMELSESVSSGKRRRPPRAVTSEARDHDQGNNNQGNDHDENAEALRHLRNLRWRSPAGCATSGGSKTAREPLPDEDGKGGAAVTERETMQQGGRRADHPQGEEAQHQR